MSEPIAVMFDDKNHAAAALDCLLNRVRWYERRGWRVPEQTLAAARVLARALGIDIGGGAQ